MNNVIALRSTAPVVTLKNGQAFANSRDVAEFFGKQHYNVLQDIYRLIEQASGIDGFQAIEVEAITSLIAGGVTEFRETFETHPQNGQSYRSFDMTRDGFSYLGMGFSGTKARQNQRLLPLAKIGERAASPPSSRASAACPPCRPDLSPCM